MRIFGGDRIGSIMNRLGVDEDTPIENKSISKALEGAQKKVESFHFDSRKNVVKYDDVMNRHRKATYGLRQELLAEESAKDRVQDLIDEEVAFYTLGEEEKASDLVKDVVPVFNLDEAAQKRIAKAKTPEDFTKDLKKSVEARYKEQEEAFGDDTIRKVEKEILLQVLDTQWMQHLENMGHLREGINWRSVGQKDPLVEYRREGQRMYEAMEDEMRGEVMKSLFHARPVQQDELDEPIETELTRAAAQSVESGVSESGAAKTTKVTRKREANATPGRVAATTEADEKAEKKKKRDSAKKKKAKRKKGRR